MKPSLDLPDLLVLAGLVLTGYGLYHLNPWYVAIEAGLVLFSLGLATLRPRSR